MRIIQTILVLNGINPRKLIAGLALGLLSFSSGLAQTEGVRWSAEMFKPASSSSFRAIGNWEEGIMMESHTGGRLFSPGKTYIQRLDDMTLLPQFNRQVQLETTKGDKSLEYQVLERLGSSPVLFASYFNKTRDRIELYGRRYNLEGEPEGKDKKIAEFNASKKSQLEGLSFVHSTDSTRMLAFFTQQWDRYQKEKIQFILFDSSLQIQLNRSIEFPYEGNQFSIHHAAVDPNGRIYLLVRIESQKENIFKRQDALYRYSLVTFDNDSGLVEDFEITLESRKIVDIRFLPETKGRVTCAGFYASEEGRQAEGVFFLEIGLDEPKGVRRKVLNPFAKEFSSRFSTDRRSRNNGSLPDFKLDHLVQVGDSAYALVAEQFLLDEICYQDFRTGMTTCNYIYNFNNIVVVKLNAEGHIEWTADIPKFQETANDGGRYSSYVFAQNKQRMYFVFNDNAANAQLEDERRIAVMNNVQRAVPVLVSLDKEGHYSRTSLGAERRNKFLMIPSNGSQISPRSALLVGVSSNKYKIGIVSLPE